jgi:hypothetical protein
MKIIGLTLVGYTWQWRSVGIVALLKTLHGVFLDVLSQCETHGLVFYG